MDETSANNTKSDLQEPLLSPQERQDSNGGTSSTEDVEALVNSPTTAITTTDSNGDCCIGCNGDGMNGNGEVADHDDTNPNSNNEDYVYTVSGELLEMVNLGLPLAISFFCRMGMASTDSAFVGHISNGSHSAMTYLAAATLSDMVVNVLLIPPLAFNQVLNALVGQAVGSGNPKMAGIWLQQSMFWLSTTMLPCLVGCFYVEPILLWLDFPADVSSVAGLYSKFNVIWPIPNGLYQCMRFYFQAQGLPRPAMYNNIAFLFINALLNYIFVFGGPFAWKGLGFVGAAISLSISRTMQCVVYFIYMFLIKKHHVATWPGLSLRHHTTARTMEFMKQTLPNIGTLLFQACANQATTILVGRLGEKALAASSALSTISIPWSGTLSATTGMVSSIRVGFHLGRGDWQAAQKSAWLLLYAITAVNVVVAIFFLPLGTTVLKIATNDKHVLALSNTLIPAMLAGTYLNMLVGNITSGVFSGMGRPFISTLLSFGLELPMSIGGVALYILYFHGNLLGVYWLEAICGGFEAIIVLTIMHCSNWEKCVEETRARQEALPAHDDDHDENNNHDVDDNDLDHDGVADAEATIPLLRSSEQTTTATGMPGAEGQSGEQFADEGED
ncbi:hypothetical protein ACA910_012156 [Epithemia clementina (nom. ined.)]